MFTQKSPKYAPSSWQCRGWRGWKKGQNYCFLKYPPWGRGGHQTAGVDREPHRGVASSWGVGVAQVSSLGEEILWAFEGKNEMAPQHGVTCHRDVCDVLCCACGGDGRCQRRWVSSTTRERSPLSPWRSRQWTWNCCCSCCCCAEVGEGAHCGTCCWGATAGPAGEGRGDTQSLWSVGEGRMSEGRGKVEGEEKYERGRLQTAASQCLKCTTTQC